LHAQVPYHFERHGPRYAALEFWFFSNCLLILNTVALGFSVKGVIPRQILKNLNIWRLCSAQRMR
jgi:hypothetical protein